MRAMMIKSLSFISYETPLFAACYHNNFEVERYLINNGANVNKGDDNE